MSVPRLAVPEIRVGPHTRGFLQPREVSATEFLAGRPSLFGGAFTWPVMVVRESALDHNVAMLARFADEHGMAFAPHGKTTMSPQLFQRQLDAGAWGLTAATAAQVLTYRSFGVPRVMLANEILDEAALRVLAQEVEAGFELLCYADSAEGVQALSRAAGGVPFQVLVELGQPGGRTGCRTVADLEDVARSVRDAKGVTLAGVAGYEGTLHDVAAVRAYLRSLKAAAASVDAGVVSAGGSAWFDLVAEELSGVDAQVILRSGSYVTHDEGLYERTTPYNRIAGELRPALEVWAQVLSVPEPGVAFAGMGKRDAPYDVDLPIVRMLRRDGEIRPLTGVTVTKLMDQHAFLSGEGLRPGDLVAFGISHPCTAFDKWRVLPVVDDDHLVTDLVSTYF